MICHTIFREGKHRWLVFCDDPDKPANIIETNQVAVCNGDSVALLDPGGMDVFPPMLAALTEKVGVDEIRHLFLSHQDPDVCSSLPLWRELCDDNLHIHVSWLWTSFISHFDRDAKMTAIPDEGHTIPLGDLQLQTVPAHYLHSSGCFSVHDHRARILFTGDVGAALIPPHEKRGLFVEDFAAHVPYMEGFHKRWMGSETARTDWVERVAKLDLDMLVPQHGMLFQGDNVKRFLDWFSTLELCSAIPRKVDAAEATAKAKAAATLPPPKAAPRR